MPRSRFLPFAIVGFAIAAGASCGRDERDLPGVSAGATQAGVAQEERERQEAARDPADGCGALPSADELRQLLRAAPNKGETGGLFGGLKEWAALVNRDGELCAVVVSTDDPAEAWPGSQQIAKAKAYTANAFSTDDQPLSTARLYTLTQPGHSLWGLAAGNPFDPACLAAPTAHFTRRRQVCGGTIVFGGGVPLYREGKRVGGLGASGDTACADHEIAKRIRDAAALNPAAGAFIDDITYSGADGATAFTHPLCANTWRNGQKLGDETPPTTY